MKTNDFTIKQSTVLSVVETNAATEIWVRQDSGIESSYLVTDYSFRVREGHRLTAIHYGRHAVALRNDTCMMKIQLLTGEDLLGSGPEVQPRSAMFWLCWAFFLACPGIPVAGIPQIILSFLGNNAVLKWLGVALTCVCYLSFVFGIPFWFIIRPRLLRRKHQQRIKATDKAIATVFNPL